MTSREEVGIPIPVHSCCNKNFVTSELHQLADDANENHGYIACLFIIETAHSDSSFHYFNSFLEEKLKNSKKKKKKKKKFFYKC